MESATLFCGTNRFTGAPAVSVANEEAVGVTTISHPPPKPACWHMKGRLTSTATGRTIALVEGVELSRSLAFEVASNTRKQKTQGRGTDAAEIGAGSASTGGKDKEELEVDKALRSETWTAFGALASSKFFMYQASVTVDRVRRGVRQIIATVLSGLRGVRYIVLYV